MIIAPSHHGGFTAIGHVHPTPKSHSRERGNPWTPDQVRGDRLSGELLPNNSFHHLDGKS
jgi:hypothetical protein